MNRYLPDLSPNKEGPTYGNVTFQSRNLNVLQLLCIKLMVTIPSTWELITMNSNFFNWCNASNAEVPTRK